MAGVELVKAGDLTFRFDYRTSELVVEAWECEVGRVKVNDLFLAYDRKVCHILRASADIMMRHGPIERVSNVLLVLRDKLDEFAGRLLKQREQSWTDGDKLAVAARVYLSYRGSALGKEKARGALEAAINDYCDSQGWNGPAGSWAKK